MPNPKNGEKIPSLIVFGRIRGSKVDQAAVFLKKMPKRRREQPPTPGCHPSK